MHSSAQVLFHSKLQKFRESGNLVFVQNVSEDVSSVEIIFVLIWPLKELSNFKIILYSYT